MLTVPHSVGLPVAQITGEVVAEGRDGDLEPLRSRPTLQKVGEAKSIALRSIGLRLRGLRSGPRLADIRDEGATLRFLSVTNAEKGNLQAARGFSQPLTCIGKVDNRVGLCLLILLVSSNLVSYSPRKLVVC